MSETVMGVWSSLVKLAGTATNMANVPSPLPQSSAPFATITQGTDGTNSFLLYHAIYVAAVHLPLCFKISFFSF